ncbi:sensor histidine kinase [Nocardia tengchongensis]|uniref:sensor histidine kinase n=1 Tax=Nocardia tengchongensis TaxID=2055889 RepID=UPI0036CEA929
MARQAIRTMWRALAGAAVTGTAERPHPPHRRVLALPGGIRVDLVQFGDCVLAFVCFAGGVAYMEGPAAASGPFDERYLVLVSLAYSLPLALRDRWPLAAWRVGLVAIPTGAWIVGGFLHPPYTPGAIVASLLVTYSATVRCNGEIAAGVWVISAATTVLVDSGTALPAVAAVTVAALYGHNVRARRLATGKLASERRRAEDALAEQAVLAERARIARELHDVVAHHISVITIQAEAVPLQAKGDPGRLAEGLAEIRALSLRALSEMRQVLGLLRDHDGAGPSTPQPGLHLLDELVATATRAGFDVTVNVSSVVPDPASEILGDLPATVGLTAYRILQESLSNAMRHGAGTDIAVELARSDSGLSLRVRNQLGGSRSHRSDFAGTSSAHGLIGMRERVAMLGGFFDVECIGDEFVVTAMLPILADTR